VLDNKQTGVYACAAAGCPLFSSDAKFTPAPVGRVSFSRLRRVRGRKGDYSHGMVRSEINCARCDGHWATSSTMAAPNRFAILPELAG